MAEDCTCPNCRVANFAREVAEAEGMAGADKAFTLLLAAAVTNAKRSGLTQRQTANLIIKAGGLLLLQDLTATGELAAGEAAGATKH